MFDSEINTSGKRVLRKFQCNVIVRHVFNCTFLYVSDNYLHSINPSTPDNTLELEKAIKFHFRSNYAFTEYRLQCSIKPFQQCCTLFNACFLPHAFRVFILVAMLMKSTTFDFSTRKYWKIEKD